MDVDDYLDEKLKDNEVLKDENGKILFLYHGTNRKFKKHSVDKNRTVLNDNYQGDWICYTKEEDVAWKYSNAARNQNFEKETFLKETLKIFSETEMKDFFPHLYQTTINLIELGFDKGWEKSLEEYAQKTGIDSEDAGRSFFSELSKYEKEKNFDYNDFVDVLESVEYSKAGMESNENEVHAIFANQITSIPHYSIETLKEMGYKDSLPEPKVFKSIVTASNILKTSSREAAKNARSNGFDLVIYSGEGTVDGEPEYLIADPKQISIQSMEIENEYVESIGIGETISKIERKKVNLRKQRI